ncbi:solute carrier family 22 member 3-like [Ostrinia furnacalis]|uniref:solute carrier family 22 member 3-like n=1 Tax=Ostrinia furnacalis TaxID=93504 RepID=UPI001039197E|nr:solute carrier family 22 member 3-like [Ostrinia furnacalis]
MEAKKGDVKEDKVYEIWEVLEKYGKYQITQYLLVCVATFFVTMCNINYIFVVGDVGYRCRVPQCEGATEAFQVSWWPNSSIDRCWSPKLDNSSIGCSSDAFTEEVERCSSWVYESQNSVVSHLNLACQPWQINMVGTIHNLGMLFSMLITGWISDRYGRKKIVIFCFTTCFVGIFKIFAASYPVYVTIEFLEALLSGGCYAVASIMMIEITGRKYRILSGVLFAYAVYMGETCFATLAILIPHWKNLVLVMYGPCILFLGLVFTLHESPRWLILNGKTEQAINNLKVIAKTNNIKINEQDLCNLDDKQLRQKFDIQNYETREGLKEVFKSREMVKRLLVGLSARFSSNFVYYGLMINSVYLPGNKYTNFLLATVMSFPGELLSLYLMNKIGRKLPLIVGFAISGAVCVLSAFIPDSLSWAKITCFLVGKVIVAVCFTGGITYTMELFPTSARGSLLGLCSLSARLGGMLAPLTPILNGVSVILPALCFGASAVITGLMIMLTPETKGMPLMDTIEQVKASKENRKTHMEPNNIGVSEECGRT